MYIKMRFVLFCLIFCLCGVRGLRILSIFPAPSHSHYTIGHTLMVELAKRGHDVTFVTPFPEKENIKNLRTIVLTGFIEEWEEFSKKQNPIDNHRRSALSTLAFLGYMGSTVMEKTLSHENVQELLNSGENFDIFIVEQFTFDGLLAVSNHFNAHPVLLSALGPSTFSNHIFGNPDIPSYMTSLVLEPPVHKNFFKRTCNLLLYIIQRLYSHLYVYPKQNEIIQKYLPNSPHILDIIYNTSLILHNSDSSFSEPLPTLPNLVQIGGFHVEPVKKLSEDLQSILDNAKNGVIYFSMGSIIKSKDIPVAKRKEILNVFSKLKETVLWKFEEDLPEKPPNVVIRKWLPQQDVLAHPNVKLFISHGGLLSTIEALSRGVPVIGIPVFGDQRMNMANAVNRGHGVMIPYPDLTEEKLSKALEEMLGNPKYSENAKRSAKIMNDRLVNPIDTAEFWLEYVVRHNGARHLRSAALDLTWYQHASIDVILFLAAVSGLLCYISYKIMRRLLGRKKSPPKLKSN